MGSIKDKMSYLNDTKQKIKNVINYADGGIDSDTPFRQYPDKLYSQYIEILKDKNTLLDNISKKEVDGSSILLNDAADLPVYESKMSKESTQETSILPSGYTQVDYIQSSGTQYIDTGLKVDLTHKVKYEGKFNYPTAGGRQLNGVQGFRYIGVINNHYQIGNMTNSYEDITVTRNQFNEFSVTFDAPNETISYSIEGVNVEKSKTDYTYSSGNSICIFSLNNGSLPSSCKISHYKIYVDDALVRDYIPCYRNSDNEVGMYDYVNDVFYTNQGTGSFTYGSVVTPPTNDFPTPSPDYPQDVKTVTGYENLFDIGQISDYTNTWYIEDIENNSLKIKVADNGITHTFKTNQNFSANKTYLISAKASVSYPRIMIRLRKLDDSGWATNTDFTLDGWTYNSYYNAWYSQVASRDVKISANIPNCLYWQIGFGWNSITGTTGTTQTLSNIQVVEGTEELPYVPYGNNYVYTAVSNGTDTNYYTIPLNGNEIAGIGNYKDELIVDKTGHCWLNKQIGKVVLDGSESWVKSVYSNENYSVFVTNDYNTLIKLFDEDVGAPLLSNYFKNDNSIGTGTSSFSGISYISRNYGIRISIDTLNASTIEIFDTWLSAHNTIIYYPLATENLIDLNYTVDITLFNGVNNITNSDDMDMEIKYIPELLE